MNEEQITVYWRWWCTYCLRLGFALRRAGIRFHKIDITRDEAAAADLRTLTGGDEITPTVLVRGRVLINPSVAEIRKALSG
ncbi:NrdH-redoxin [Nocardia sp. CDC159]|uniref:NrdH-redoxin n=1 Tax=Nocardia pulmonis TaxID=2951408 RepID=A0A9X2E7P7_9NOCA|nr:MULTISPECIES: glutaredoxin domain-containing protein [Nocardia]MCM6774390.1 NrdH-redoxin [Nocardia pulmonis]MCM6787544.1 NrdH-redoxin [Nocardia sp. CDC159]